MTHMHPNWAIPTPRRRDRSMGAVAPLIAERMLPGLAAIADRYRGFILDLWGVVHDGERPYPGAVAALDAMAARGAGVCLLSNSPRRASEVAAMLQDMGVGPARYDHLVTSGEETFAALRDRHSGSSGVCGSRCLHLGPRHLAALLDGLDVTIVENPSAADFLVATGFDATRPAREVAAVLRASARRALPMVCANPDLVVLIGGRVHWCAGALALQYEELGGTVIYHGKPTAGVYRQCLARLGLAPREVLAVGDALRTDVAGANAMTIDVAFVTSGIHREELGAEWGAFPDPERIAALFDACPHRPTLMMPALRW